MFYTARNADTARRMFQLGEHGHVTDRYGKAVEQLGSTEAPVRLGGLYAPEQLAQNAPALRQTAVDVICSYLRMPYTPPGEDIGGKVRAAQRSFRSSGPARRGTSGGRDPQEEHQVRLTAQRILAAHLRFDPPTPRRWWRSRPARTQARHWTGVRLDLTGAALVDFDLSHCRVGDARFGGVIFIGFAEFDEATFTGGALFDEVTFTRAARFVGATFTQRVTFSGAIFTGPALFRTASFTRSAWFERVTFSDVAGFGEATFTSDAKFGTTTFSASR
ncbi:pentapeptide repeat-containing protein [Nonomuraea bangladeshensis]